VTTSSSARSDEPVRLVAPAKLTLSLRVVGVRDDGYHLLDAEMASLDLGDVLELSPREDGTPSSVSLEWADLVHGARESGSATGTDSRYEVANDDNLVTRALRITGRSAHVHVVKQVPPGAGLGGGSSDAAAILRWAGISNLDEAAALGADVPFCLTGRQARVGGIGEVLRPVTPRPEARALTLFILPFGMSTPAVYRSWDKLSGGSGAPAGDSGEPVNHLEAAALAIEPRLGRWRDRIVELTGLVPRLAGSGSTWFVEGTPESLGFTDRSVLAPDDAGAALWGNESVEAGNPDGPAVVVGATTVPGGT
jgi:4-diphosphocytidyl-2-C-methyl-D-erythritol kinase